MPRPSVVVDETNARAIYNYFNRFLGENRYVGMADDPAVKKLWKNDVRVKAELAELNDLQYDANKLAPMLQAWVDKHIPMSMWKLCLHALRQKKYDAKRLHAMVRVESRTKSLIKDCMSEAQKSFDDVLWEAINDYYHRRSYLDE